MIYFTSVALTVSWCWSIYEQNPPLSVPDNEYEVFTWQNTTPLYTTKLVIYANFSYLKLDLKHHAASHNAHSSAKPTGVAWRTRDRRTGGLLNPDITRLRNSRCFRCSLSHMTEATCIMEVRVEQATIEKCLAILNLTISALSLMSSHKVSGLLLSDTKDV